MPANITYEIGKRFYINLTNRCTNRCDFCIKNYAPAFQGKFDLWLPDEPTVEEVAAEIPNPKQYEEIIFCVYGEPLLRLDAVIQISQILKKRGATIRVDTDGLANLTYGRNILPDLCGSVDAISVSLNAPDSSSYMKHCRPTVGPDPYGAVLQFITEAKKWIPVVEATVVELPDLDINACRERAGELGVPLIVRPFYTEMYILKKKAA